MELKWKHYVSATEGMSYGISEDGSVLAKVEPGKILFWVVVVSHKNLSANACLCSKSEVIEWSQQIADVLVEAQLKADPITSKILSSKQGV